MTRRRIGPRAAALVAFAALAALVCLNWWLFRAAFGANYFLWYLKNGSLIALATGLLKLVWDGTEARYGLVSAHPAAYAASCLQLFGVFLLSVAPRQSKHRPRPKALGLDIGLDSTASRTFDALLYLLLVLLMLPLVAGWLLVVAPLGYFVTLVAGVPARQQLRGELAPAYVHEQGGQVAVFETDEEIDLYTSGKLPEQADDRSFARDPFAVTQALTAVLLWLASLAYDRLA